MIAKISGAAERHDDMAQLVTYLFGPGRSNEHVDPHPIAAAAGLDLDLDPMSLAAQLDAPRRLFSTVVKHGSVWTAALSTGPDDRRLTDAEWADAARTLVDRLGFGDDSGRAPCRWVAVRHGVSKRGNDHIHIAVGLVREDGTRADLWRDRVIASAVCADLEQRFRLTPVEGRRDGLGHPGYNRANAECAIRRGRPEPEQVTLARHMRAAAVSARDEQDFLRRLAAYGLIVRPRRAESRETVGLSVALPSPDGTPAIRYGGRRLGADLTLPRLRRQWPDRPDADSVPSPDPHADTNPRPAPVPTWTRAASEVARARRRIRTGSPHRPALWACLARETAGVLAAWSLRDEPGRPGPMARAADVLARSAVHPGPVPRSAEADLRSAALAVTGAPATSPRARADQARLLRELRLTIEALRTAESTRRPSQAAQLGALEPELRRLEHRLRSPSLA
ncbi:relaxase/mobilization nuclease domain-containing protein [Embleya sp. MST-111070]|uniref:relaxase/mobilization nuclease domain-containing protein n=1 Tax=Embleya sp. MST-111070 TaxID=3398231 RepID=UPI003F740210